jgi:hypothetical protein
VDDGDLTQDSASRAPVTARAPQVATAGGPGHGADLDAMGKDKRRQVVGHSYGPSRRQQLTFFGIVGILVLAIWLGSKILVSEFDKAPARDAAKSPWSQPTAPQVPPARPF